MSLSKRIRLIIADDHSIFRKALASFLPEKNPSIQIVGQASNGEELIQEAERNRPDIVLTDIQMPIVNGHEASRIISKKLSFISVIALTMFSDADMIFRMFEAGAKGYVTKNAEIDEIAEAVNTVFLGDMYYCASSSTDLIKKIGPSKFNHHRKNETIRFTEREFQLMKLICLQLTTKEIADKMKISARTVEEYSQNIKQKIDAKNMVGIALYALKNNIVSANEI